MRKTLLALSLAWGTLTPAAGAVKVTAPGVTVRCNRPSIEGTAPTWLVDGSTATADLKATLVGTTWTVTWPQPATVVQVRVHHRARAKGWAVPVQATLRFDNGRALPLRFPERDGWTEMRVPQYLAREITLRVEVVAESRTAKGGLDELEVYARGPLPLLGEPASRRTVWLNVSRLEPQPTNPLGVGFMLNYFERGLVDGLTKPEVREEFLRLCRDFGVTSLRFPGGSLAYVYPPWKREGLEALRHAGLAALAYNLWFPDTYDWCSALDYFRFCRDADLTVWYQLNPGYWIDPTANVVHQIRSFDGRKRVPTDGDYLSAAVAEAVALARWCRNHELRVVWEVGNEDYEYYAPETYAAIAAAFIRALRGVTPQARFALCGDGPSWSDREWQTRMLRALRKEGITHFDFASVHLYLTGVGEWRGRTWYPLRWDSPERIYRSTKRAWSLIKGLYAGRYRQQLDAAGFRDTQFAFTEFNVLGFSKPAFIEHCAGRALGEAMIYPDLMEFSGALFLHDLVRSGPGTGNFFQRLDYYPTHPPGERYRWQVETAVLRLLFPHVRGALFYDRLGVAASWHPGGLYVTALNPTEETQALRLVIRGLKLAPRPVRVDRVRTESLASFGYDYYVETDTVTPEDNEITLLLPPYSASGVWLQE
ncbi:MAG TPA: hypothetical protein EYP85_09075 [Armatimonadetes bacterium]|nr:hypothetical protein [Armatimonadota bacterium]